MEDKDFKKPEDRYVLKRSGKTEKIDFRKIRERLERLAREHKSININLNAIIELVERSVVTGILILLQEFALLSLIELQPMQAQ